MISVTINVRFAELLQLLKWNTIVIMAENILHIIWSLREEKNLKILNVHVYINFDVVRMIFGGIRLFKVELWDIGIPTVIIFRYVDYYDNCYVI